MDVALAVDRLPLKVVGLHNGSCDLSSMARWMGVAKPRQIDSTSMDIFCPIRWWIELKSVILYSDIVIDSPVSMIDLFMLLFEWDGSRPASIPLFVYTIESLMSNRTMLTLHEVMLEILRANMIKCGTSGRYLLFIQSWIV